MNYTYKCSSCNEEYNFSCKMSELDEKKPRQCKKCNSTKIEPIIKPSKVCAIWKTGGNCGGKGQVRG